MTSSLVRPILLATLLAAPAATATTVGNDADLRAALESLKPGSVLRIKPGHYRPGLSVRDKHGTPDKPIIIEGSDPKDPPIFSGGNQAWHFVDCSHLVIRSLRIKGQKFNGLNVDDGGSIDTPAHHITLENIHVSDIGPRGNFDAIKLSGLDHFAVKNCTIEGWGGQAVDMVGCHHGVIEGCTFRGKDGYSQTTGPQTKGGSADIVIRHNRFEQAGGRPIQAGGSTGMPYFRPAGAKYEARNITIHDNIIIGGQCAAAFAGLDGGSFHHNTIAGPDKWIFRILQETTAPGFPPCRNVEVHHNLTVFKRSAVRTAVNIGANTAPKTFRFHHNLWFASDNPKRSEPVLPSRETDSVYDLNPRIRPPALTPPEELKALAFGARAAKP